MWWKIAIGFGIVWVASWVWYFWENLNDDYIELAEKTRWTNRPFVPIFMWPNMLRAWKDGRWFSLFLYFCVNLLCVLINAALLILAFGLALMLLSVFFGIVF
ncbi:MAG: hypothetical protein LUC43_02230 [Burkholderiales bacterium]|nr:hypothetical protein [Burkholderiales bacterium]